MSEFPEWFEREWGVDWEPSYEDAQAIHQDLRDDVLKDPRTRGVAPIWWRRFWPFNRRRR